LPKEKLRALLRQLQAQGQITCQQEDGGNGARRATTFWRLANLRNNDFRKKALGLAFGYEFIYEINTKLKLETLEAFITPQVYQQVMKFPRQALRVI
jgi:hypothetical protein